MLGGVQRTPVSSNHEAGLLRKACSRDRLVVVPRLGGRSQAAKKIQHMVETTGLHVPNFCGEWSA